MWSFSEAMKTRFTTSASGVLRVAGPLDVYAAGEFREALLRQWHEDGCVDLDLCDVTEGDVVALQLIESARRTAVKSGGAFQVSNVPVALIRSCTVTGISPEIFSAIQPR